MFSSARFSYLLLYSSYCGMLFWFKIQERDLAQQVRSQKGQEYWDSYGSLSERLTAVWNLKPCQENYCYVKIHWSLLHIE